MAKSKKKFSVNVYGKITACTKVVVEAETAEEAQLEAVNKTLLTGGNWKMAQLDYKSVTAGIAINTEDINAIGHRPDEQVKKVKKRNNVK